MSYVLGGQEWPKLDPITNRFVCHACWNVLHSQCGDMHNVDGRIQCDHFRSDPRKPCPCVHECGCVHLSEKAFADEEKARIRSARRARRDANAEALENSPLRAHNPKFDKHAGVL